MKQKIRTLNDAGIQGFRTWLQSGGTKDPPVDSLLDPSMSEPVPGAREVEHQDFASRFELAAHVLDALRDCDFNRINYAGGLWGWLSLFYIDLLCPKDRQGRRTVLELPRYLLTPEYRNYYRHLIREAVILVRRNGEFARALLTSRAGRFRISSVFEEIAARQDLMSNPGVVELVWRLYFNPKRKTVRPGIAGHGRPGGIRRFALVLQQFSLNYDLPAMTAKQIADLLPREFDAGKRRANWEPVVTDGGAGGLAPRVRFDGIPVGSEWRRSRLAELWGYGNSGALRPALIAPRGYGAWILFMTDEAATPGQESAVPVDRPIRWVMDAADAKVRRLGRAQKDDTPAHLFRRSNARAPFVYLGRARVQSVSPTPDGRIAVEFQSLEL